MTEIKKNGVIAAEKNKEEESAGIKIKEISATYRTKATENECAAGGKGTNGKEDHSSDEVSKLEFDIIKQVEYYFGDSNLHRDKFLLEEISKNKEGWVPFSVLLTFNRLADLSTNVDEIVNAILKSNEGLLEVSYDRTMVRRHPERPVPILNEEAKKDILARTVYADGFPRDTQMSELLDFFGAYEKVVNITMRKYYDKESKIYKFKGSVLVTFERKEQCVEFLSREKVEYKGHELLRMWQESYIKEKREEGKKSRKWKIRHAESPDRFQNSSLD